MKKSRKATAMSNVNAQSLAQRVYSELLRSINDGRCRPGDRVREPDVAEWLGVSRTPVREALRQLQSEGVLAKGTQGLFVVEIGENEVLEMYELRVTLDAAAAALAAKRATEVDRRLLARLLKQEAECDDDDIVGLAAVNREFHCAVAKASHNVFLLKALNSLQDAFLRLRSTTLSMPNRPKHALDEHRAIANAIVQGNSTGAAQAARKHIDASRQCRLRLNKLVAAAQRTDRRTDGMADRGIRNRLTAADY